MSRSTETASGGRVILLFSKTASRGGWQCGWGVRMAAAAFDWSMSSVQQSFDLNSDSTTSQAVEDFGLHGVEPDVGIGHLVTTFARVNVVVSVNVLAAVNAVAVLTVAVLVKVAVSGHSFTFPPLPSFHDPLV